MAKRKRLNGSGKANGHAGALATTTSERRKMGAPTKVQSAQYNRVLSHLLSDDFPDGKPIEALCKLGLSDNEIADVFGVPHHRFKRWLKMSPKLRAAVHRGRRIADAHVVRSLYKQATGYTVPEEKIFYSNKNDKVVRAQGTKYYPPNVLANIFWLKNRFPEFWRDRKEIEIDGGPQSIQQVKFVLVKDRGESGNHKSGGGEVIDANYQVLPQGKDLDTVDQSD